MSYKKLTDEQKRQRAEERKTIKEEQNRKARIEAEKNQPRLDWIQFSIEWKRSRTWGYCPRCTVTMSDSYIKDNSFYASGWGYDKLSTVIGQACDQYLRYLLWDNEEKIKSNIKKPYGISYGDYGISYSHGVGIECYFKIFEFLGWKFERTASGDNFDVYRAEKI